MESRTQVLKLPEDDASVFEHFLLWLYRGKILDDNGDIADISWDMLIDLSIFGDARGIPGLQNDAIDKLIDKEVHEKAIYLAPLRDIYRFTSANSSLRRLFVDWCIYGNYLGKDFDLGAKDCMPKEFLLELVKAQYNSQSFRTQSSANSDFRKFRSEYHVDIPEARLGKGPEEAGRDGK